MGTIEILKVNPKMVQWDGSIGEGVELTVNSKVALGDAYIGCSIAVNGVCLTAISFDDKQVRQHLQFASVLSVKLFFLLCHVESNWWYSYQLFQLTSYQIVFDSVIINYQPIYKLTWPFWSFHNENNSGRIMCSVFHFSTHMFEMLLMKLFHILISNNFMFICETFLHALFYWERTLS